MSEESEIPYCEDCNEEHNDAETGDCPKCGASMWYSKEQCSVRRKSEDFGEHLLSLSQEHRDEALWAVGDFVCLHCYKPKPKIEEEPCCESNRQSRESMDKVAAMMSDSLDEAWEEEQKGKPEKIHFKEDE